MKLAKLFVNPDLQCFGKKIRVSGLNKKQHFLNSGGQGPAWAVEPRSK
jgi:hypothetical protein